MAMNSRQYFRQGILELCRVVVCLQTGPETVAGSKKTRQPQPRVNGDGTLASNNFADAALRR